MSDVSDIIIFLFSVFSLLLFIGGIYVRREDREDAERFRKFMDKAIEATSGRITRDEFRQAWDGAKYAVDQEGVSYSANFQSDPTERGN